MINSALFVWMSILVIYVRSRRPDLTNMQIAILLMVTMTPGPHYATDIAGQLQASTSAISKAVLRLVSLGYLQQGTDLRERRKEISVTPEGAAFLDELKSAIEPALKTRAAKVQLQGLVRGLDLIGDDFRTAFPLPEGSAFEDLLAAIDRAP